MFTIKMHSVVDLITNSSTVIYTDYSSTVEAVKDLMSEILSVLGEDVSVDDAIFIDTIKDSYWYSERYDELMGDKDDENPDFVDLPEDWYTQYSQYCVGVIPKPFWMSYIENNSSSDSYYDNAMDNDILIRAKEPRFETIVEKIKKVIFSPESDASYDG